jgi:molybdenum cofactor cytidylyltransferase
MKYKNCAIVILAAGDSSRLGRPKQLVEVNGKTLLQHTIDVAIKAKVEMVCVVLGSNYQILEDHIKGRQVEIVHNKNWQDGMATSITCGLNYVLAVQADTDKIIFMVCDQVYVNTELINALMAKQIETQLPIIASAYGETFGIPALFSKEMFGELLELSGETGAGKLIRKYKEKVATVFFDKGEIDVDEESDLVGIVNG